MIKRNYFISVELFKDGVYVRWECVHFSRVSLLDQSKQALNEAVARIMSENDNLKVRVVSFNRC